MRWRTTLPGVLAAAGMLAVLVGIHQELVLVRPLYEGSITTGWSGPINHEERLLAQLGVLGLLGALTTVRWRSGAAVPVAVGGIVFFYSLRAAGYYAQDPGLYTGLPYLGRATSRFILGGEPYWLVGAGVLFVAAGIIGSRFHVGSIHDLAP